MKRLNVLGVGISAIDMSQAVTTIGRWIGDGESRYVCVTPVHSVVECQKDRELRRIFNASGLTTPDGMPLVWLCHLKGHRHVERVYGPDLMLAVCRQSVTLRHRHFFYGGTSDTLEKLLRNLRRRFPELLIAGSLAPPFRPLTPEEDAGVVQAINSSEPDIVWVGLGSPKQERWMAEHVDRLSASLLIGVGAAFDFHAGLKRQAPRWVRQSGLEWLFRLLSEPGRLWRRYLISNPIFIALIIAQLCGLRDFPLDA